MHLVAVAVVFDFVEPPVTLGGLGLQGGELGFMNSGMLLTIPILGTAKH
jgi:hypothetical protein